MNFPKSTYDFPSVSILLLLTLVGFLIFPRNGTVQNQSGIPASTREDAYRANNIGVGLLEQFKYKEGADAFKRALQIDPKLNIARINLSIALFNLPDLIGATREAQASMAAAPDAPQPNYILGLIAKQQNRADEAVARFQRVLKIDPNDVGANVNVGQIYSQQRKYPEAIAAFRAALATEPYNATALYNLGQALMRSGQREEGLKATSRFQDLRQRGSATTLGTNYLEQGKYAEAVASTGAEPELVDKNTPAVKFEPALTAIPATTSGATSSSARPAETVEQIRQNISSMVSGDTVLFDADNDGDFDLFSIGNGQQHLYRNDGGKFVDISTQSSPFKSPVTTAPMGVVAGDFDNDGKTDLFVIREGALVLYHNDGGATFSDVTSAANIPAYPYLPASAALVDVDHDGDLDIFVAGLADLSKVVTPTPLRFPESFAEAPNLLLRNDGNGKFTNTTANSNLPATGRAASIVPTDFNNRRDMDLLIVSYDKPPALFSNQRDGSFRDVANEAGLQVAGRWSTVAAGDINKDGFTDFFLGQTDGPGLFAMSDGKEKFNTTAAPPGMDSANAAQFLDYDNDGLLDCLLITNKGLRVWRNVGNSWSDVTATAVTASAPEARSFSAADTDGDGDTDLILHSATGFLSVLKNEGGSRNKSLRINLAGKVSNRVGIGSKIEVRAGSLVQKIETSAATPAVAPADVLFGLGKRPSADVVRVLWPSGVLQAETEIASTGSSSLQTLNVTELDRKPSSCPYLYTWNGERFEFITDFMGGGEMGYLEEPGRHNKPDPIEYVRIRNDQLRERNGRFELRVTNELEEALFADRFQLLAVAHPSNVDIYPNEGMTDPPKPFRLFVTRGAHTPLAAVDDHGHDVLSRITRMDRAYPDDFSRDRIRGYAAEHSLTLKLSEAGTSDKLVLLLTGWTDYAWSSDNVAASQAGKSMKLPAVEVKDSRGQWHTAIEDIGIPVGRPQTVTVDLTGKFLSANREVRIVTSMRILWDQILVADSAERSPINVVRLDPTTAQLRWRGFSREITPDGREPFGYDYEAVSFTSPWKVMPGSYTREGDVRELLLRSDDMFVISQPGDEISVTFDATLLPPLPKGWMRTFLLFSDGYSKEMDINSASPDQVSPLPFHGMTSYPYSSPERYPTTALHRSYLDRYNTRVVRAEVPSINTLIGCCEADLRFGRR